MKLKLIVAALAIAASASAHAQIERMDTGNGELFLDLFNEGAAVSATFDLAAPTSVTGMTFSADPRMNDVLPAAMNTPGAKLSWDLNSYAEWASFKTAAGGAAGTVYDLAAFSVTGATGLAGNVRILTTSNTDLSDIETLTNGGVIEMSATEPEIVAAQNQLASQQVANGAGVATSGQEYYGNGKGVDFYGNFTGTSIADVGTPLSFYHLTTSGTPGTTASTRAAASVTPYAVQWNLDYDAGTLSYSVAAVPEADTWAMLLAGLGLMGFIARRRLQA